jgi:phage terminase large subunit-like protein
LLRWSDQGVAYCTHTGAFANTQSRGIRRIAASAGLKFASDSNRQDEWEIAGGGGLCARGLGGELTGRGFRLIVIDDPVKSREQAESAVERAKIWDWINDDVLTRLSPDGFVFLVHTRWHPDDPIGRAKLDSNWHGINLPALSGSADDIALLPDVWSVDFLRNIRDTNPYKFASLYQGEPRPRGGKVFGDPTWYDPRELPGHGYQIGHGCDLAYAAKTYSDQSVMITGIRHNGLIYVVDAIAKRCQAHEFAAIVQQRQELLPGPCRWYCSTTERGTAGLMRSLGANIIDRLATADKFVRAQPAANAWNLGKILLPSSYTEDGSSDITPVPDWAHELLEEVGSFTGVSDRHDDFVDSLAAMFDQLNGEPEPYESKVNPKTCVQSYDSPMRYG